jgi:hypothetical protein
MKEKVDLYIDENFWKEWEVEEDRIKIFVPVRRFDQMAQDFKGVVALEFERKQDTNEFYLGNFVYRAY